MKITWLGKNLEANSKVCSQFCMCSTFYDKVEPTKIIDFVDERSKKPKAIAAIFSHFSNPTIDYRIKVGNLGVTIQLSVRRSFNDVKEKLEAVAKQRLSPDDKKEVGLLMEAIETQKREIQRSDEYEVFFKFQIHQAIFSRRTVLSNEVKRVLSNAKVKELLDFVGKVFPRPFHVSVCPRYKFLVSQFRPVGGFTLPTKIPMPLILDSKFGESELVTYGLRFKNSPIGLENLEFDLDGDWLILELRASYELTNINDMLTNSYAIADNMADLMVVKITNEPKI
jgi:hypothetical protein